MIRHLIPAIGCIALLLAGSVGSAQPMTNGGPSAAQNTWRTDESTTVWARVAASRSGVATDTTVERELAMLFGNEGLQVAWERAEEVLQRDPWNPVARRVRFLALFLTDEFQAIIDDAALCATESAALADCDFYAALAYARLGDWGRAQELLERRVEFANELPGVMVFRKNLAEIYLAQGAVSDARVLYSRLNAEMRSDVDVLTGLTAALVAGGDFDAADELVRDAILSGAPAAGENVVGTAWLVEGMELPWQIIHARLSAHTDDDAALMTRFTGSEFAASLAPSVLDAFVGREIRPEGRAQEWTGVPCSVVLAAVDANVDRIAVLCTDRQLRVGRVNGGELSGWTTPDWDRPVDSFVSLAFADDGSLRLLNATGGIWTWSTNTASAPVFNQLSLRIADGMGRAVAFAADAQSIVLLVSTYGTEGYCLDVAGTGAGRRVLITYDYGELHATNASAGCAQTVWLSGHTLWRSENTNPPSGQRLPGLLPTDMAISADGGRIVAVSGQTWFEVRGADVFLSGRLPMVITSVRANARGFIMAAGQRVWWLEN
jgi:hypothetical protein